MMKFAKEEKAIIFMGMRILNIKKTLSYQESILAIAG